MFTLRMVWRELRAAWGRLLFFFLCVAIGVGAIAALRSVIQNVREALVREARVLTAADVVFSTNRPWPADTRARVDAAIAKAPVRQRVEVVELATMVRPADESRPVARMAELQAVDRGYPLYGQLVLRDGQRFDHACSTTGASSCGRNCWCNSASPSATWCASATARSRSAASSRPSPDAAPACSASVRASSSRAATSRRPDCSRSAPGRASRS